MLVCHAWAGDPGLYKRAYWASHGEHSSTVSASVPSSRYLEFLPWLPFTMNYNLKWNKSLPPQTAFVCSVYHSKRKYLLLFNREAGTVHGVLLWHTWPRLFWKSCSSIWNSELQKTLSTQSLKAQGMRTQWGGGERRRAHFHIIWFIYKYFQFLKLPIKISNMQWFFSSPSIHHPFTFS